MLRTAIRNIALLLTVLACASADVGNLEWLSDERLIFTLTKGVDEGGQRIRDAGLGTIGRDGKRGRSLQQQDGRSTDRTNAKGSERTPRVLDLLAGDDKHILVLLNEQRDLYPDVYRMRVRNGSVKKIQTNFANVRTCVADNAELYTEIESFLAANL